MGLFGRKGSPEKDLAKALALPGVQGRVMYDRDDPQTGLVEVEDLG